MFSGSDFSFFKLNEFNRIIDCCVTICVTENAVGDNISWILLEIVLK